MASATIHQVTKYLSLDGCRRETPLQEHLDFSLFNLQLPASITHGHGVASQKSANYPAGTIALQYPFFKQLGLDLGTCHGGTLNLSIHPKRCEMINPTHIFKEVDWYPAGIKAESFSFCDCALAVGSGFVLGYVYKPDPATKTVHHDREDVLQIISPKISSLNDDSILAVYLKAEQCRIVG